jgi:hypothetical protein
LGHCLGEDGRLQAASNGNLGTRRLHTGQRAVAALCFFSPRRSTRPDDGADPIRDARLFGRWSMELISRCSPDGMFWATFALVGIAISVFGSPVV